MTRGRFAWLGALTLTFVSKLAAATSSAELYTATPYGYGRFEARVKFAGGDGVVSSFFLWKDGSEKSGTFWNELDFEKVGGDCHLETNPLFGSPAANHPQRHALSAPLCDTFHVYTYEWTPESIVWLVDGVEIRRESGATASAYADNASAGMQLHFNLWPGDASFGGNLSPSTLPVHQYVDWVQFSSYDAGSFTLSWREDFDGAAVPSNFQTGNWGSPKNKSNHDPRNVNIVGGCAVLSMTADDATGPAGALPCDADPGSSGGGAASNGGAAVAGGSGPSGGTPATPGGGGSSATGNPAAGGGAGPNTVVSPDSASSGIGACSVAVPTQPRAGLGAFAVLGLAAVGVILRRKPANSGTARG